MRRERRGRRDLEPEGDRPGARRRPRLQRGHADHERRPAHQPDTAAPERRVHPGAREPAPGRRVPSRPRPSAQPRPEKMLVASPPARPHQAQRRAGRATTSASGDGDRRCVRACVKWSMPDGAAHPSRATPATTVRAPRDLTRADRLAEQTRAEDEEHDEPEAERRLDEGDRGEAERHRLQRPADTLRPPSRRARCASAAAGSSARRAAPTRSAPGAPRAPAASSRTHRTTPPRRRAGSRRLDARSLV